MENPSVQQIVQEWLIAHGYDGLCNLEVGDPHCGCKADDVFPCGEPNLDDCVAGYLGPPDPDGGDFAVYPTEAAVEAALARKEIARLREIETAPMAKESK